MHSRRVKHEEHVTETYNVERLVVLGLINSAVYWCTEVKVPFVFPLC